MNSTPLVSVLTATYNAENYIASSIESVLKSTYSHFELLICDDCSTDKTVSIAKKYAKTDDRIKVYINQKNLGDYPNRNKVASYAQGKYIKYLDHDDTINPLGLETMVCCMEKYPQTGFGLINIFRIHEKSKYPILISPVDAYLTHFFKCGIFGVGPTGAIIRRDAFESIGGFSGKPFVGDVEIWLKLSQKLNMVLMPSDLIWYRIHENQESKREHKDVDFEVRRLFVIVNALTDPMCPLPKKLSNIALRNYKNIIVRKLLLKHLNPLKWKQLLIELKRHEFKLLDVLKSFKKNVKISNMAL